MYHNEAECAVAIKKVCSPQSLPLLITYTNSRQSGIPRSEVFFTTKIAPKSLSYDSTKKQISDSLQATGFSYLDLVLIHAPFGGRDARKSSWKALVEAQKAGQVRSLGVSNFGLHHLQEMEEYTAELESEGGGKSAVDVGQWEIHPWMNRSDVVGWCKKKGVVVEAFAPLVRSSRSEEPVLQELGKKYGKSTAQILVRWSLQKGYVPLPKSVTLSRIEENRDLYDFALSDEEMGRLEMDRYESCAWDPTTQPLDK